MRSIPNPSTRWLLACGTAVVFAVAARAASPAVPPTSAAAVSPSASADAPSQAGPVVAAVPQGGPTFAQPVSASAKPLVAPAQSGPASSALPSDAPALPDSAAGDATVPQNSAKAGQAAQSLSKSATVSSPFKWTNFLLGFLGGAVAGGAFGILSDTTGKTNVRNTAGALYAAAGGVSVGTIALLLGATSPAPVKPPQVGRGWSVPMMQVACRF